MAYDGPVCWPSFEGMADFTNKQDDEEELVDRRGIIQAELRQEVDAVEREAIKWALSQNPAAPVSPFGFMSDSDSDDAQSVYSYNSELKYPRSEASYIEMERAYCAWVAPPSLRFLHLDHCWDELGGAPDNERAWHTHGRGLTFIRSSDQPYIWDEGDEGRQRAPFPLRDHYSGPENYPTGPHVLAYDVI